MCLNICLEVIFTNLKPLKLTLGQLNVKANVFCILGLHRSTLKLNTLLILCLATCLLKSAILPF